MTIVNHARPQKEGRIIGQCKARGCMEDIKEGNNSGFCRFCCNTNEAKAAAVSLAEPPWEEAS